MKSFPFLLDSHLETEEHTKHSLKKIEARKSASIVFQTSLSKIEELEEKKTRGLEEVKRPKSAQLPSGLGFLRTKSKKCPIGLKPFCRAESFESIRPGPEERKKQRSGKSPFEVRDCRCWSKTRPPSAFGPAGIENDVKWHSSHLRRKCRSVPDVSKATFQKCKKIFDSERDLYKVKRSLRLLGFELSDLGIYSSGTEITQKSKREKPTTYVTKVTGRSVALESVRLTVKKAWTDDCLDESHRRLLAQAAYEEWYFKKEKELHRKREEERIIRMKTKESFKSDFERKKKKSEEEYKKWLLRKRTKRKDKENLPQKQDRLIKAKEESEKAFIKWKQAKEKEFQKKKREKQKEEEKRIESEKQKNQKKIIAEKAFQKWKSNLEEGKKLLETKMQNKKKKQEEERRKRKEGNLISFQMWKTVKDEEMKEKIKHIREMNRMKREERLTQMEEKMYEAEQAFEEWLEKVDLRKQKQQPNMRIADQKIIPWIPI